LTILTFALSYLIFATGQPQFNKWALLQWNAPVQYTFLVIVGVSIVLTIFNLIRLLVKTKILKQPTPSFFFDRNFFRKCRLIIVVAAAFAAGIVLSNVGLSAGSVVIHSLFRASEVFWVIFFGVIFLKEYPSIPILYACAVLIGGCILTSVNFSKDSGNSKLAQVIIGNFASAVALGFQYTSLKALWTILNKKEQSKSEASFQDEQEQFVPINHEHKNNHEEEEEEEEGLNMDILEVTECKTWLAALVMFPVALGYQYNKTWGIFVPYDLLYVLGGIACTLGLQSSLVALSSQTSSTTVGFVSQLVIFNQFVILLCQDAKNGYAFPTWEPWLGFSLIILGGLFYSAFKAVFPHALEALNAPLVRFMRWLEMFQCKKVEKRLAEYESSNSSIIAN